MSDFWEPILKPRKKLEVVNIPNPLCKSLQGKYFVGQTDLLTITASSNAWGALINPSCSGVNLFANAYTVSNFSERPLLLQVFFNTNPPGKWTTSTKVSPANTALKPQPVPKVQLQFSQNVKECPSGGVNVFDRIVPPGTTLTSEEDGKFIFPPGGNWFLFLTPIGPIPDSISALIAFGWWEEKIKHI